MSSARPRICLINMPFATPQAPSIALTQLKAVLGERFAGRATVEIHYLNLDFLALTGDLAHYQAVISGHGRLAGTADWFFRQAAFPDAPDNTGEYLERFYFDHDDPEVASMRNFLLEKRPRLTGFLDALIKRHRLDEASVVGFTSLFFQTMASFALARRLKHHNPAITTVIGGASCEAAMGRAFACHVPQIDFVFSGPALISFPTFIDRHLAGDRDGCAHIDGVFCRTNLDLVRPAGADLHIDRNLPLDYEPFLDRLEAAVPPGQIAPMLLFETSRGCSWGEKSACSFCGLNGLAMRHRAMAPEHAITHIQSLFRHVPRCRFFLAVDTIVPKAYFDEVFPRLGTPSGIAMMYEVRATIDARQLRTLCDAGVFVVQPGIESLDTATLKLMRKGTTAFVNLRFLKNCVGLPLHLEWNLLLGSPGEPDDVVEHYLKLIPRLTHLHPPGGAFPISFDRFSQYFDRAADHHLDLQPQEFYQYAYPLPPAVLRDIAYHFVNRNADHDRLHAQLDRLNAAITAWRTRWRNQDGLGPARLVLEKSASGTILFDNRDGRSRKTPVTAATVELLALLETPQPSAGLQARIDHHRLHRELTELRNLGVLFEENDRVFSLVTR
jgi:magnesium-protoporphyrin IX monomethyl ester (oxidative) cyclase